MRKKIDKQISEGIEVVDYRVDLDKYGWKDNN